ncbi:delta(14)-sterol reductase TM7SF2 isoform X4 [Rhipicephalus sanguineus]|uniref:delta(14)-sterol reductase TM7SF2 isoform X4 n=1 Tax=Rhipicephalus sanguineus TaxID=34632 RepID=UPI0020C3C5C1|nr:delta(14)-sterol reductase TM7SF2 isoform X4 [Rhipicephalus sanguineus]XP_049267262.1 delta(14)-sterol reductase TM7SF2 isoform X4 [Rhipicephalus sanguineus]
MAPPRKSNVETETSVTVRSRTTRSRSSSKSPEKKRVTSRSRSRSASRAAATSSRTPRSPQKKAAAPKSPSPTKKAKSPARKSPAPKSPGRPAKTTRPKSPGRPRSPAPKSPARKSPAAKSPARKTPAKTRAPSKSPAGTATQRKKSVSPARERGGDSPRAGPSRIPVSSSSSSSSLETASQPPARSRASLSTPLGTSASQPVVNLGANSITRRVVSSPATGTAPHVYSVPGVRSSPRIATMHSTSLEEDEEVVPSTSKKSVVQFVEPKGRFQLRMPQVRLPFRLGMSLNALLWFFLMPSLALVLHLLCQKDSCTVLKTPIVPRTLDAYFHWKFFIGYPAFLLIQALLQALPVGRTVQGFPSKALKHRISYDYRINGYVNLLATAAVFGGLAWYGFPMAIPYRHILQLLVTAITFAPVLALFLYIKGRYSSWEHQFPPGNTGNVLNDYVKGRELSPRIGRTFDLAALCFRCGLLTWAILLGAMAWYQFKAEGCLDYGFAVSAACQMLYICTVFMDEEYYLSSAFVNEDGLGYVAVASFLVLMPFVSALPAKFLLEQRPKTLPLICYAGVLILFLAGLISMHIAHKRKYHLRRNWPDPSSRGPGLDYLLDNAGNRLVISGLWGFVRHPNYLADLVCHLAFALPCGFHHVLPFYSVLLSTLFLVTRTLEVERKCRQRYGDLWASYTQRVKYRLVPYVF